MAESSNKKKIIKMDACPYNNNKKKIRLNPNPEFTSSTRQTNDPWFDQAFRFCEEVRKQMSGQEYWVLLQCLQDYAIGEITMVQLKKLLKCKFPHFVDGFIDLFDSLAQSLEPESEDIMITITNRETKQNKNMIKTNPTSMSMSKLDHHDLTPSYQFLPSYLSGDQQQNIEFDPKDTRKELNRCCYSKCKSGSGKRVWPRDNVEKLMNEREDELYERDMLKGWIRATKEEATKLNASLAKGEFKNDGAISEQVKKHFKSYNLRVVEKMYGDHSEQMVGQLLDSPQSVLPTLIDRLDQVYSRLSSGQSMISGS